MGNRLRVVALAALLAALSSLASAQAFTAPKGVRTVALAWQ
jgi:hypothetical protein